MITEDFVRKAKGIEYWRRRYERHGERVPGTSNKKDQKKEYEEKIKFVSERIPKDLRTLDYGCGIGHYSHLFGDYLGFDPISIAIGIAQERNPEKRFTTSEYEAISCEPELVLFATVLQHIKKPELVLNQLKSAEYWVFFENIGQFEDKNYIFFRDEVFYRKLAKGREIKTDVFTHKYINASGEEIIEPHLLLIARKK